MTSGRFNESVVHRSVPNFVIQGGQCVIPAGTTQLSQIAIDGTIANEFNQSNLRGTVAMAKVAGDPDSATSQWFINVADNVSLTVKMVGLLFLVASLRRVCRLLTLSTSYREWHWPPRSTNFQLSILAVRCTRESCAGGYGASCGRAVPASNRFDETTEQLVLKIDAGDSGFVQVAFSVESQSPQVIVRALAESAPFLMKAKKILRL